jgi:hypothetical protein
MFVLRLSHRTNSAEHSAAWGAHVYQLVQKLSPFYGIRMFGIVSTTAHS